MMLIGFVSTNAKDVAIRFVTVFVISLLLALLLNWLAPYRIDATQGFVRGAAGAIAAGRYEAAFVFGFMLGYTFVVAPFFFGATRRMWSAIDAGRYDQSRIKVSPIYLTVLVTAVVSYSLYLAGVWVRQTILQDSMFGYLFAYQVYTSIFLLSVCDLAIALNLRLRAGARRAVK
ncbi:hypothetical protein [Bradyrhizobium iriomotense]|uniref:hypothetical protein n=1 Tax=Bradyrhizobium iriomotense TaxID=441950 RepID=UPI001B8A5EBB|nr:hypothetical protein [Bradyrhizobium iriomotense]MBR0781161.1 hypothetical protein [Bradyrhizobium iriomotense]